MQEDFLLPYFSQDDKTDRAYSEFQCRSASSCHTSGQGVEGGKMNLFFKCKRTSSCHTSHCLPKPFLHLDLVPMQEENLLLYFSKMSHGAFSVHFVPMQEENLLLYFLDDAFQEKSLYLFQCKRKTSCYTSY